jgi:hypothetical protein
MSLQYFIYTRTGFNFLKLTFSESDWDRYRGDFTPNYVSLQYNGLDKFKSDPELDFNELYIEQEQQEVSTIDRIFDFFTFGLLDDVSGQDEWDEFFTDFKLNHSKRDYHFSLFESQNTNYYDSFVGSPYEYDESLIYSEFDGSELY